MFIYHNRKHAGEVLAKCLRGRDLGEFMMLALPRGGVPIAHEISLTLCIPFHVLVVRKIGHPESREFGIGALVEEDNAYLTNDINYSDPRVLEVINEERKELKRRIEEYRYGRSLPEVKNREILLVDDGLATGVTATAGAKYLKAKGARRVVLAVPVGPPEVSGQLGRFVDEIICPERPQGFTSVGRWYEDFDEVTDEEVLQILSAGSSGDCQAHHHYGG